MPRRNHKKHRRNQASKIMVRVANPRHDERTIR